MPSLTKGARAREASASVVDSLFTNQCMLCKDPWQSTMAATGMAVTAMAATAKAATVMVASVMVATVMVGMVMADSSVAKALAEVTDSAADITKDVGVKISPGPPQCLP